MPKLEGSYTAKRDAQNYAYEVTWRMTGQTTQWEAKVRLNEQLVGIPSGQVLVPPAGGDLTGALRREIESAIEHRMTID